MKIRIAPFITILGVAVLTACSGMPTAPLSQRDALDVRAAAQEFTQALKASDAGRLKESTVYDAEAGSAELAKAVVGDTLSGREIQVELSQLFADPTRKTAAVGSDPWIEKMEQAAENGPILQAGDRVRVGEEGSDGNLYLRNVNGLWKVEVISTLVAESGGGAKVEDPAVEYRFKVTRAINEWMLERLARGEFKSFGDYQKSRNMFWMQYLTYVANGKDPRETLLPTLPPMPKEEGTATER